MAGYLQDEGENNVSDEHRPQTWGGSGKRSVQAVRTTGNIQAQAAAAPEPTPDNTETDATDAAKALAAQHGIDLATVTGTGSDGRITKDDVQALVTPEPEPEPEAEPETGPGDNEPEQLEVG